MKPDFLYLQISRGIQKLIETGVLQAGDKLDSVRMLSKQQGVSLSTAFKAYEDLVNKDFIEARPKSGYYVGIQKKDWSTVSDPIASPEINPIDNNYIVTFALKNLTQKGIVKLSSNVPDISLLPVKKLNKSMNQVLRSSEDGCLNYENISGNPELRRHISRQALQWKGDISPNEVIITQGCTESILLCLMTLTKPGDTVVIGRPTYFGIFNLVKNLGLKIVEIDIHPARGMNLDYLEKCLKKVKIAACLFIPTFDSPTGYCMQDDEKQKLVEMLAKNQVPLIEDDINGDIYFGDRRPRTCKSFDKNGLVLLCSSFSKTLAPGYRIGWCLPGQFKDRFLDLKLMHTVSTCSPTQAALAHFFNFGRYDLHMNKLRKTLHIESIRYLKVISDIFPPDTKITKPKGGFVLWIELDKKINTTHIFYEAFAEGVSIWPGQIFSASLGFENFIRIGFGTPLNRTIEESLRLLGQLCRA